MANFDAYAGQLVASGVRPNAPVIALEAESNPTVFKNLESINGLMPKISKVFIHETRTFNNPLDALFTKYGGAEYGCAVEHAAFMDGATNKKNDGKCIPRGNIDMASQLDIINYAYDIDIEIKDREVNKAVMNAEQVGAYVANKMKAPMLTMSIMKFEAEKQLLSDVIDGTRTISSSESSDGTGTTVSYNPTIKGYAGVVESANITLAPVVEQDTPAFTSVDDVIDAVELLETAAADMKFPTSSYNKLGIKTVLRGKPVLVAEEKTLNAMDNAIMNNADQRLPTRTAREFIGRFADIVELDSFAALPTNSSYANKRLGFVLIDREVPSEHVVYSDIESQRCAKQRLTGYSAQGESILGMWRGAPSYAMLLDTQ